MFGFLQGSYFRIQAKFTRDNSAREIFVTYLNATSFLVQCQQYRVITKQSYKYSTVEVGRPVECNSKPRSPWQH
jgi:hypothetical protein